MIFLEYMVWGKGVGLVIYFGGRGGLTTSMKPRKVDKWMNDVNRLVVRD